jgi:hypothetical protein
VGKTLNHKHLLFQRSRIIGVIPKLLRKVSPQWIAFMREMIGFEGAEMIKVTFQQWIRRMAVFQRKIFTPERMQFHMKQSRHRYSL